MPKILEGFAQHGFGRTTARPREINDGVRFLVSGCRLLIKNQKPETRNRKRETKKWKQILNLKEKKETG